MMRLRTARRNSSREGKSRAHSGSPKVTCTGPGYTWRRFFGVTRPAPVMATGTTGTSACSAMAKGPFLKACTSPSRLRVPSGKTMRLVPERTRAAARAREATARAWSRRSTGTCPPRAMYQPKIGQEKTSALATKRTWRGMAATAAQMSMALAWLEAKMAGPSGRGARRTTRKSTPAIQSPQGPQALRANHIGRSPEPVRSITGREPKKKSAMNTAA